MTWRKRSNEGKLVGKFNERVFDLIANTKKTFFEQTADCQVLRERALKLGKLVAFVQNSALIIFRQQLLILQNDVTASFRKHLIKIAGTSEGFTQEEGQQAIRKALFEYKLSLGDLESDVLGFDGSQAQSELTSSLQAYAQEFQDSVSAKLETIKKMGKMTSKPRGKKRNGGLGIALNLVGMLRPPGTGTLQGFVGYSTGLLGLPLDLLLGVHNDGDSPEVILLVSIILFYYSYYFYFQIMGDDREYPILRLQPKVHFDINF